MNEVTVDAALRARLNNLDDLLQVRDESGRILGYSHPVVEPAASEATSIRSPSLPRRCAAGTPADRLIESRPGRTRTCAILLVRQASSPLDDGTSFRQ